MEGPIEGLLLGGEVEQRHLDETEPEKTVQFEYIPDEQVREAAIKSCQPEPDDSPPATEYTTACEDAAITEVQRSEIRNGSQSDTDVDKEKRDGGGGQPAAEPCPPAVKNTDTSTLAAQPAASHNTKSEEKTASTTIVKEAASERVASINNNQDPAWNDLYKSFYDEDDRKDESKMEQGEKTGASSANSVITGDELKEDGGGQPAAEPCPPAVKHTDTSTLRTQPATAIRNPKPDEKTASTTVIKPASEIVSNTSNEDAAITEVQRSEIRNGSQSDTDVDKEKRDGGGGQPAAEPCPPAVKNTDTSTLAAQPAAAIHIAKSEEKTASTTIVKEAASESVASINNNKDPAWNDLYKSFYDEDDRKDESKMEQGEKTGASSANSVITGDELKEDGGGQPAAEPCPPAVKHTDTSTLRTQPATAIRNPKPDEKTASTTVIKPASEIVSNISNEDPAWNDLYKSFYDEDDRKDESKMEQGEKTGASSANSVITGDELKEDGGGQPAAEPCPPAVKHTDTSTLRTQPATAIRNPKPDEKTASTTVIKPASEIVSNISNETPTSSPKSVLSSTLGGGNQGKQMKKKKNGSPRSSKDCSSSKSTAKQRSSNSSSAKSTPARSQKSAKSSTSGTSRRSSMRGSSSTSTKKTPKRSSDERAKPNNKNELGTPSISSATSTCKEASYAEPPGDDKDTEGQDQEGRCVACKPGAKAKPVSLRYSVPACVDHNKRFGQLAAMVEEDDRCPAYCTDRKPCYACRYDNFVELGFKMPEDE
ncbi:unnamed protein product, partial [Mesorhabditis spiculigera]